MQTYERTLTVVADVMNPFFQHVSDLVALVVHYLPSSGGRFILATQQNEKDEPLTIWDSHKVMIAVGNNGQFVYTSPDSSTACVPRLYAALENVGIGMQNLPRPQEFDDVRNYCSSCRRCCQLGNVTRGILSANLVARASTKSNPALRIQMHMFSNDGQWCILQFSLQSFQLCTTNYQDDIIHLGELPNYDSEQMRWCFDLYHAYVLDSKGCVRIYETQSRNQVAFIDLVNSLKIPQSVIDGIYKNQLDYKFQDGSFFALPMVCGFALVHDSKPYFVVPERYLYLPTKKN
jgi:hypothetical protein